MIVEQEVGRYVNALVEAKEQKITRLSDETLRNWAEIVDNKYLYNRDLIEAKATKEITKDLLLQVRRGTSAPKPYAHAPSLSLSL
jgi:hypothetical protein